VVVATKRKAVARRPEICSKAPTRLASAGSRLRLQQQLPLPGVLVLVGLDFLNIQQKMTCLWVWYAESIVVKHIQGAIGHRRYYIE